MTRVVGPDDAGIDAAVAALRRGELVGLPTETVYGLAADLGNERALRRIFAVKGRPVDHPLIVHVSEASQLDDLASETSDSCRSLVDAAWPGPLTVVVRASSTLTRIVTGGQDTVAVRMPAHPVAREIIRRLGRPVAAPSANRFGRVSPTTAEHVVNDLGADVDVVVDGGPCEVGVESTIVDCTAARPRILRPGAITAEDLASLLQRDDIDGERRPAGGPRAPGTLERHYAPMVRLVLHESLATVPASADRVLDCNRDVVEAAKTLYSRLRDADVRGDAVLHVVLPPARGLGHALRDRLTKAAAGR